MYGMVIYMQSILYVPAWMGHHKLIQIIQVDILYYGCSGFMYN